MRASLGGEVPAFSDVRDGGTWSKQNLLCHGKLLQFSLVCRVSSRKLRSCELLKLALDSTRWRRSCGDEWRGGPFYSGFFGAQFFGGFEVSFHV